MNEGLVIAAGTLFVMMLGFLGNAYTHSLVYISTTQSLVGAAICFIFALIGFSLVK